MQRLNKFRGESGLYFVSTLKNHKICQNKKLYSSNTAIQPSHVQNLLTSKLKLDFNAKSNEQKYSRIHQVKFAEDTL